jgi:hypothetical protein
VEREVQNTPAHPADSAALLDQKLPERLDARGVGLAGSRELHAQDELDYE